MTWIGPDDPADRSKSRSGPDDQAAEQHHHDLEDFLSDVALSVKSDYERIRRNARDDPGTAGDQSENTWAELLRDWLPPTVTVTTKGRIIARDGRLSDQMDVVVLRDTYPRRLAAKKIYLAAGVLAAFECKLTLRRGGLHEASEHARQLRSIIDPRGRGNLRDEVVPSITYGLLAHGSERVDGSKIDELLRAELDATIHPREALDVVCIANSACWTALRQVMAPAMFGAHWALTQKAHGVGEDGGVIVSYARWVPGYGGMIPPNPIYRLVGNLLSRFAADIPGCAPIADYWLSAKVTGNAMVAPGGRAWPLEILSPETRAGIKQGRAKPTAGYLDPWATFYL